MGSREESFLKRFSKVVLQVFTSRGLRDLCTDLSANLTFRSRAALAHVFIAALARVGKREAHLLGARDQGVALVERQNSFEDERQPGPGWLRSRDAVGDGAGLAVGAALPAAAQYAARLPTSRAPVIREEAEP